MANRLVKGKKRKLDQDKDGRENWCGLPAEVIQVAQRIGLRYQVSLREVRDFVAELITEKGMEKMKHQTYNIRDVQGKLLRFAQQKHHANRRKKQAVLTSEQRKKLFDVRGKTDLKYSTFLELHKLWLQYMGSVVSGIRCPLDEVKLLKADYHGAAVVVDAARNPDLVNLSGIVIQETKNTFRLITSQDRVVVVPKMGTIVAFLVSDTLFKVNGAYISISPQSRSKLRLKARRKGDDV